MRKLTKGFLIFGVVTTVIGFVLLFVGIQSDGIKSLLAMSKEPVYDSRMEELTFGKEVENLEITLHQHALTITDSLDDQIHISYHPSLSAHHDLVTNQNDKTLSLTDKKLSETPFLSSGIGGILHIASSYSRRFEEVILQVPKGRSLKGINVSANRGQTTPSKDSDARWTKKNGLYKLGYKQHTRTDEEGYSGLNLNQDKATKP